MRKVNPVNKMFSEIDKLMKAMRAVSKERDVWPLAFGHDCAEKDCFKRDDGLWEQVELHNTGQNQYRMIFVWRTASGYYCFAGQPCYLSRDEAIYMQNSETEKLMYTQGEYTFHWMWNEVTRPTRICWGLKMGPLFYEIRKNGEVIANDNKKASIKRFWTELMSEENNAY